MNDTAPRLHAARSRWARAIANSLVAASCAIAVSGCTLPHRTPAPPVATYVLSATAEPGSCPASNGAPSSLPLEVATPTAAPAFRSAQIAYIETPYRIDYFADNQWVDTPGRMLQASLTAYLVGCGLFDVVSADGSGIDARLRLDTDILELVQVFEPASSEVRVSIRFTLVDIRKRAAIVAQTVSTTEPALSRDPYGGVVAANKALQRLLAQLAAALREPVATLAAGAPGG